MANRAFIKNHPFVTAVVARIHRMIDRAVADSLVVHHFHDFGDGAYIFLCFAVQFYIRDMPTACDDTGNPSELAAYILARVRQYREKEPVDDMTVLVMGLVKY